MKKNKLQSVLEDKASESGFPEQSSAPAGPPEPPKRKRSFLGTLIALMLFLAAIGAALLFLPWETVANFTPDQWFKKELSLTATLPQPQKDAINTIYRDLITRTGHDRPGEAPKAPAIDPYEYLANRDPALKSYSRTSMLKAIAKLTADIKSSGVFVKDDYFLTSFPDADVLQWEVQYNKANDFATPTYFLLARLRNSTGAAITRAVVEIYVPADTSIVLSGLRDPSPVTRIYSLVPGESNPEPPVEIFACPIRKEEFDLFNGRGGTATLKKAYLTEK